MYNISVSVILSCRSATRATMLLVPFICAFIPIIISMYCAWRFCSRLFVLKDLISSEVFFPEKCNLPVYQLLLLPFPVRFSCCNFHIWGMLYFKSFCNWLPIEHWVITGLHLCFGNTTFGRCAMSSVDKFRIFDWKLAASWYRKFPHSSFAFSELHIELAYNASSHHCMHYPLCVFSVDIWYMANTIYTLLIVSFTFTEVSVLYFFQFCTRFQTWHWQLQIVLSFYYPLPLKKQSSGQDKRFRRGEHSINVGSYFHVSSFAVQISCVLLWYLFLSFPDLWISILFRYSRFFHIG